jgi:hypothetical protein
MSEMKATIAGADYADNERQFPPALDAWNESLIPRIVIEYFFRKRS